MVAKAKLTQAQIEEIRANPDNLSQASLAARYGVHQSRISRIRAGESFRSQDLRDSSADLRALPLDRVRPDPDQPRKHFDAALLAELAASIRSNGLLQAITVRRDPENRGGYLVVAGERRWRAHRLNESPTILARVIESEGPDVRVAQIVENMQRADVTPLEEARAFQELLDDTGWTVEKLAQRLGMRQAWRITERTSLLRLREEFQDLLAKGHLTPSQAYEMSRLEPRGQDALLREIRAGRCATYNQLRAAADGLVEAAGQAEMFAPPAPVTEEQRCAAASLQSRIDQLVALLSKGFDDGEVAAVKQINPNLAAEYADKLALIQRHVALMEKQLRRVGAAASLIDA